MSCSEVFCRNVKAILAQRDIRIKDFAQQVGLSESYLSLVLNGLRKNLSDEHKDRIAACLNLTVSQLFSDDLVIDEDQSPPVLVESLSRSQAIEVAETFLKATNLEALRMPLRSTLALMNDSEVDTVRRFLASLMGEMQASERWAAEAGPGDAPSPVALSSPSSPAESSSPTHSMMLSLSHDERALLAIYSVVGQEGRLEWVKAASGLPPGEFTRLTDSLKGKNLLLIIDGTGDLRFRVNASRLPMASIFTFDKMRLIHLSGALAMEAFPDQGPYFEEKVADHFFKAGTIAKASSHLKKAAEMLEDHLQWAEAAKMWHQLSVYSAIQGKVTEQGNCLAEAARCLCASGQYDKAEEVAVCACQMVEQGRSSTVGAISIMMGNMMLQHDAGAARTWYERGLRSTPAESQEYGRLLINLATVSLQAGKFDEAEGMLTRASRWVERQTAQCDPERATQETADHTAEQAAPQRDISPFLKTMKLYIDLNMGLIEQERRNWSKAKLHFQSCLDEMGEDQERLDTVLHNLGTIMHREGDLDSAVDYLSKAQDLYKAKGLEMQQAYAAVELAKVFLSAGKFDSSGEQLASARPYLTGKASSQEGWLYLLTGCLEKSRGRLIEAAEDGRRAVDIFQKNGDERNLACASLWLSAILAANGEKNQGRFLERRAYQIYQKRRWDLRELLRDCSLLEPGAK